MSSKGPGLSWLAAAVLASVALEGCAPRMVWRMPSPDHRMHVELRPHRGRTCVRVGGRREGCFEAVAAGGLTFSPDGRHVAYPVAAGARWRVVRDGHAGAEWDGVAGPAFSSDGRRLVYAAQDGRSWRLVRDGNPGEPWDSLCASSITLSPAGDHVAYVAVGAGGAHAVHDNRPGPAYDRIETLRLSPDGARLAYVAWSGGRATLVVDEAAGSLHDSLAGPVFSADGGSVAYAARDSDTWFVVRDSTAFGPFVSARVVGYGRGDSLVSVVMTPEGEVVRFGNVVGPHYASVESPAFSRNRLRWGYIARRGDSSVVVLDAATHGVEEQASNLVFSDDGARHAYIASRAGRACIVDDAGAHPYDLLISGSLVFGRDGKWACVAADLRRHRLFVTAEGIRTRRAFDWTMISRITRSSTEGARAGTVDDAVRSWITAEAERMREGGSGPHGAGSP